MRRLTRKTFNYSFTRSHLEYSKVVRSLNMVDNRFEVKRVQYKFLKYAAFVIQRFNLFHCNSKSNILTYKLKTFNNYL